MALEVIHLGHTYTYRHPVGWSGGDQHVRETLNGSLPAGDYPENQAEEMAIRHALGGILAGGELVVAETGRHIRGGQSESEEQSVGGAEARPDRIVEEVGEEDRFEAPSRDPDRILED